MLDSMAQVHGHGDPDATNPLNSDSKLSMTDIETSAVAIESQAAENALKLSFMKNTDGTDQIIK